MAEALDISDLPIPEVAEHLPCVLYRCVVDSTGQFQFVWLTAAAMDLFGLPKEEILADPESFFQRVHVDDMHLASDSKRASIANWKPYQFTFRFEHSDGLRWIESRGVPLRLPDGRIGWDGVFLDVTHYKTEEVRLQRSQTLLETARKQVGLGCWDFELATGKITWTAETFAIHGHAQALGEPDFSQLRNFYHPEDFLTLARSVDQVIQSGTPYEHELRIIRQDTGELRHVKVTGGMMRNPMTGIVERLFGTLLDITSQKTLEETLKAARDAAEAAARAKADFLATMSHEVRTPLNGILGMATLLAGSGLLPRQQEYCDTIRNSGESLMGVVNDILDFSRIDSGRLELEQIPFDLRQLMVSVSDIVKPQAQGKGLRYRLLVPEGDLPPVLGDPGRLRQVLLNLSTNAIKFTECGSLQMELAELEQVDGSFAFEISISDTGIGIQPEVVPNLFQRFSQADASTTRRFGGTGLGLAICKNLIQMMGGEIGVESNLGQGSRFWFRLRLERFAGCIPKPSRASDLPLEQTGAPLSILLAEDNRTNQRLATIVLEKAGHRVQLAQNGREAIDLALRENFDVILMDCQMPEVDGYRAAREIRRIAKWQVPIIALTASVQWSDQQQTKDAGMDDYLAKPYQPHELLAVIDRWRPAAISSARS